ncbi:hypothetical protein MY5147_001329 [Beauveria neobassiana]
MLLPSAIPCDRGNQGMVSPPASPPKLSSPATFHIISSCFPLQSLVAGATESQQQQQQQQTPHNHEEQFEQQSYFGGALLPQPLPTPPMAHTPSPMKLRLRTRNNVHDEARPAGIVKRITPPRHKRTFSATSNTTGSSSDRETTPEPPTTPKRSRIAPERIPRGLARADFHSLYDESQPVQQQQHNNGGGDGDWTVEDDRLLVELVLEKLKLSKADWQDCARTLGRDRHALTRRWKSLVLDDDVGLKRRKIPATWR